MCINWYLITTYYYTDGSSEETKEYVGTTCDSGGGVDYLTPCPDCSGGGSESNETEHEITTDFTSTQNEEAYTEEDSDGGGYVLITYAYRTILLKHHQERLYMQ